MFSAKLTFLVSTLRHLSICPPSFDKQGIKQNWDKYKLSEGHILTYGFCLCFLLGCCLTAVFVEQPLALPWSAKNHIKWQHASGDHFDWDLLSKTKLNQLYNSNKVLEYFNTPNYHTLYNSKNLLIIISK